TSAPDPSLTREMRLVRPELSLARGLPRRLTGSALALLALVVTFGSVTPAGAAASYPNDPYYGRQWNLRRIGAPQAWKVTKGKGITIAIIDTGVARQHEDLARNMSP